MYWLPLDALATDARIDSARLAFGERAWRLGMRIAGSLGDEDRLPAGYHDCQRALEAISA